MGADNNKVGDEENQPLVIVTKQSDGNDNNDKSQEAAVPSQESAADKLSYKLISFVALVTIGVTTQLAFKLSQSSDGKYEYDTKSAMCIVECVKLFFSFVFHFRSPGGSRSEKQKELSDGWSNKNLVFAYFLLALSYAVYNQLIFVVMKLADPGTFTLLKSFTPVFVGLLNFITVREYLSELQIFCILIQIFGIIPVVMSSGGNNECEASSSELSSSSGSSSSSSSSSLEYEPYIVILMVFTNLYGSFNTVYNATFLRGEKSSVNIQNIILYTFGALINFVFYFAFSTSTNGFFHGYGNPSVILLLILNSFVGIAITMIYKYGGAVLKTLTTPFVSAILVYLSHVFFDAPLDLVKASGAAVVVFVTILYMKLPQSSQKHSKKEPSKSENNNGNRKPVGIIVALLIFIIMGMNYITNDGKLFPSSSVYDKDSKSVGNRISNAMTANSTHNNYNNSTDSNKKSD